MGPALKLALAVALAGCMRIYPDPELPDLEIEWDPCEDGARDVEITIVDQESGDSLVRVEPCEVERFTLEDVKRHRYQLHGRLLASDGTTIATAYNEVDLRNGFDESSYMYFGSSAYFRVAWEFDIGASCQSLGAELVLIDIFAVEGDSTYTTFCEAGIWLGYPFGQTIQVQLRALADEQTVAISPRTGDLMLDPPLLTDAGTLTLTPCGASCP